MPPPRASSADKSAAPQTPEQIALAITDFCEQHPAAAVLEDGKAIFDLRSAQLQLSTDHGRCTLQLWSDERNLVRRIVSVAGRSGTLRLATARFGHSQTKLLELVADRERRTPSTLEATRESYVKTLQRVLLRRFPDWKAHGLSTARDLEKSFGPAYARGLLVRGQQAWAVIGVNQHESAATVEGILTLGILWLQECRERSGTQRLVVGLRVIVPQGRGALTHARLAWMNHDAAQWELWELDERAEELEPRELDDQGNLHTHLVHHPDEQAAADRFAPAIAEVLALVPPGEQHRVEPRLRHTAEMAFLLHGLEFARARIGLAPNSFGRVLELTVGWGPQQQPITPANRDALRALVADLFARRCPPPPSAFMRSASVRNRRIGAPSHTAAHMRLTATGRVRPATAQGALRPSGADPLFRAAPERWLESVLRRDLAPLTRGLAPASSATASPHRAIHDTIGDAIDDDALSHDNRGNRAEPAAAPPGWGDDPDPEASSRVIPRLDPRYVYAQVPAIAGAGDRGLLDLLGVTADGRLAVIELKADDDLHMALQGLDYWVRVRHHHRLPADPATGLGEFQRHGYFSAVPLSPLPPRLYLVAPALHIHPATETVLRYLSPQVEWALLALDERWRQQVRVVWRRQGGRAA